MQSLFDMMKDLLERHGEIHLRLSGDAVVIANEKGKEIAHGSNIWIATRNAFKCPLESLTRPLDHSGRGPLWEMDTKEEAMAWITNKGDVDNERFAFIDDLPAMAAYTEQKGKGCGSSIDELVLIGERLAYVGCNFGH
jgi:hypothetical protein